MKLFTFLFSLLPAVCGTVSAQTTTTPITSVDQVSEANNRYVYYITARDNARGTLYTPFNDNGTPVGQLATCGATYSNYGFTTVTRDPSSDKQHFAIITYKGNKYLYSVAAGMFSYDNDNKAKLTKNPTLVCPVTLTTNVQSGTNYFLLSYRGSKLLSFSNNQAGYKAVYTGLANNVSNNIDDGNRLVLSTISNGGSQITLTDDQYETAMGILRKFDMNELVANAESMLSEHEGEPGYPNSTAREALTAAKQTAAAQVAAEEGVTDAMLTAMETAISAYYATTEVNLPVAGKAYRIKGKYSDGTYRYIKYDASVNRLNVATQASADLSDVFICKPVEGNKVALVNPLKGYLTYYADGKSGVRGKNGFVTDYTEVNNGAVITLEHRTAKTFQPSNPTITPQDVYGSLSLQAYCGYASNGATGNYYLMAGTSNFHDAGTAALACGPGHSSFFYFEETDYPACNKPNLNTADGIDEQKSIATFSAPFATVLPYGVEAYTISTVNEDETTATPVLLAQAGEAIPAGTGVILYGDYAGQYTMAPATTETVAAIEGTNLLEGTPGAAADKPADGTSLLLGKANNVVGFYNWASGQLGMNKAYLHLPAGLNTLAIRLNFGEKTGINDVKAGNDKNAAVYDLCGRRVMNPAKGGIYIRNGKKVIL